MNETFMKEKPVLPLILSMTLPMVLSMLANSLYNISSGPGLSSRRFLLHLPAHWRDLGKELPPY